MMTFTVWLHVSQTGNNVYYRKQTFYKLITEKVCIFCTRKGERDFVT